MAASHGPAKAKERWLPQRRAIRLAFLVVLICLTASALLVATLYTRDAELPMRTIRHLRASGLKEKVSYDFSEQQRYIEAAQLASQDSCVRTLAIPKVALMFLTRGDMPHEASWRAWLRTAEGLVPVEAASAALCRPQQPHCHTPAPNLLPHIAQEAPGLMGQHLFSVYVHPGPRHPGYPPGNLFHGRGVPNRVQVRWGEHSMVEALRALLRAALADPLNQRFQLLCEHALPLQSPLLVYQQLVGEARSRVDACNHPEWDEHSRNDSLSRWTPRMAPAIPEAVWRKSSQWVALTRPHAMRAVEDTTVNGAIQRHCRYGWDAHLRRKRDCYADEHYVPVLLASLGLDNETTCNGNTVHVSWQSGSGKHIGEHPMSYSVKSVSLGVFLWLRQAGNMALFCNEVSTVRSVRSMFVHASQLEAFSCQAAAQISWDATVLEDCPLFSRKFGNKTAEPAVQLLTSCEPYLGIAPPVTCQYWQ